MLSRVSTLLLRLMIYRSVVYRNGIGVMNIQLGEEYKNAEKGEMERGFSGVGAGAREKLESEPGAELGRWSRSRGPNSEDGVGAGGRTRKMESEPGAELGRWSRSQGPNSEDGVGAGGREKRDAVRNMSMKRRRDTRRHDTRWFLWYTCKDWESKSEMDRRRRDCDWVVINSESLWDEPGPAVVPQPLTITATDSTTGLRPIIHRVPQAPPDVASSRLWWHGLCALECVCVMTVKPVQVCGILFT